MSGDPYHSAALVFVDCSIVKLGPVPFFCAFRKLEVGNALNHKLYLIACTPTDAWNEGHQKICSLFVVVVKDAINRPMLRTSNKLVKKAAVDVFKQVQIYMGDRMARSSPTQAALEVVSYGWNNTELRDEIFVQLCRQTNNNPKP